MREARHMKKVYWRPQSTPFIAFVLVALFSIAGLLAVEHFRTEDRRPHYQKRLQASRLALEAMEVIKNERIRRGDPIDKETDPVGSGLIGAFVTSVTSEPGSLQAKQTSINPNLAAVIVDLLDRAKVREGDSVAVSFSGSFPALNIAVLAALKTLNLKPTIISSVSGSQWGANAPDFLWVDMERLLQAQGLFPFRSAAASLGGRRDRARELTEKGREQLLLAVERNGLPLLEAETIRHNIDERMAIYFKADPPKAYINVGGGRVSAGPRPFKVLIKPGLLPAQLSTDIRGDSVIRRFLKERIPIIQLWNIRILANEYGLPIAPTSMPAVGEGEVYYRTGYNRWLAGSILVAIIGALYLFSRSDWGFRILQASSRPEEIGPPEPMV
jgi:poly-gamma-glutamate system protein